MFLPIGIAVSSVAAGTLLALLPGARERILNPVRTFALAASLAVVTTHLLPEAFVAIGGLAILVFAAALLLPSALHAAFERFSIASDAQRSGSVLGLEAAFAGLLLHQLADGVSLGAYGGTQLSGHAHADVLAVIAAHTVPVVAILVLGLEEAYGRRSALLRAGILALATIPGIWATEFVSGERLERASAWIAAGAAGLLLHVVSHGAPRLPRRLGARAADFVAALAGVGCVLTGSHVESALTAGAGHAPRELGATFSELLLDIAPPLLFGLLGAVLLGLASSQALRSSSPAWSRARLAFEGTLAALEHPLTSLYGAWNARSLLASRPSPSFVVPFLTFGSELGLLTFFISARLLGWRFALVRLFGAVLVAALAAVALARLSPALAPGQELAPDSRLGRHNRTFRESWVWLIRAFTGTGAWLVVGLIASAFAEMLWPLGQTDELNDIGTLVLVLVLVSLALLSCACAPAATVLGSVLVGRGLAPGALLACLLLTPAVQLTRFAACQNAQTSRPFLLGIASVLSAGSGLALAFNRWQKTLDVHTHSLPVEHAYGWFTYGAACTLGFVLLVGIWQVGASVWFSGLWNTDEPCAYRDCPTPKPAPCAHASNEAHVA